MMASSSSQLMSPQTPARLRGVASNYPSSVEYNACPMEDAVIPSLSPYDLSSTARPQTSTMMGDGGEQTENHLLIGGSMNTVNDKLKQVSRDTGVSFFL